ncbi:hypothetical protein HY772_00220 [Candidatus Woesearchaeota archaeon]|nr:hypothetical protein [Candidatus Woesearchaeota archaeon]
MSLITMASTTNQLEERTEEVRRALMTLRWDIEHNQFNESKRSYYKKLEEEYANLNKELEQVRGLKDGTNQDGANQASDTRTP